MELRQKQHECLNPERGKDIYTTYTEHCELESLIVSLQSKFKSRVHLQYYILNFNKTSYSFLSLIYSQSNRKLSTKLTKTASRKLFYLLSTDE